MKTLRGSLLSLVVLFLAAPLVRAQDLAKYRHFTLGMNLTTVLACTDQKMTDVKTVHGRPALIQEVTWWPLSVPGPHRSDGVEQILFSFYNGKLYRISVTYDPPSMEGLTEEDMVKSISAKYGPATIVAPEIDSAINIGYEAKQKPVASWDNAQYSVNLVRSPYSDALGLIVSSKGSTAQADLAIAEAVKLDEQEGPKRETARQKKQTDDLEAARQKNRKSFRP
jgi:hypothetical protein